VKIEQVQDVITPVATIISRVTKSHILSIYKVPDYSDVNEFLVSLARKVGKLSKGGIPNTNAAARIVLQDWTNGKIPFYTVPPQISADVHVGASIVNQFAPDFDASQAEVLASLDNFKPADKIRGVSLEASQPMTLSEEYMNGDGNDTEVGNLEDSDMLPIIHHDGDDDDGDDSAPTTSSIAKVAATTIKEQGQAKQTKKQDLSDEADQYNPQTNKNIKKQLKQEKKRKQKETKDTKKTTLPTVGGDDADYNFATDYMNSLEDDDNGVDVDDVDVNDIDVDDIDVGDE